METVSGEDDIIEVPLDENSDITQENVQKEKEIQIKEIQKKEIQQEKVQMKEEMQKEEVQNEEMQKEIKKEEMQMKEVQKEYIEFTHSAEKCYYLNSLGLITKSKFIELQNRRVERKRRSTANPHFVYSMLEQPSVSNIC